MKQYTIINDTKNNLHSLAANEIECICPFQTKLLVPGQLAGQIGLQQFNCSSQCMFFDYDEASQKVTLNCVQKTIEVTTKPEAKLHLFKPLNTL